MTQSQTAIRHSGHLGMAVKMAEAFEGDLIHVNGIGWHRWDKRRWAPDGKVMARRAVHALLRRQREIIRSLNLSDEEREKRFKQIARYETASAITGILTEAAVLQAFSVEPDDLDADPHLFNFANGTLDLHTFEKHDHDPADRISKIARAAYDKNAVGTEWTEFLEKVLPDKKIREYLQRVIGVALLGKVARHSLDILTGVGANGKGTLYGGLCFAFGDYADMAHPELFMSHRNPGPAAASPADLALRGLRLVVVTESRRDQSFDEARLKRLTGGDLVNARGLHKDPVTFRPSHTPLFVTNHLPKVSGDDDAIWRRLRVVPFDVVIPEDEQDVSLGEKLEAEADAVLMWAIEGYRDYLRRGEQMDAPAQILARTQKYRTDFDDVGQFLDDPDWIEKSTKAKATTLLLHGGYSVWAKEEGGEEISLKAFGKLLDNKGYPVTERTKKGRFRAGLGPGITRYTSSTGWISNP